MQPEWNDISPADLATWFRCSIDQIGSLALGTLDKSDLRWRSATKREVEEYVVSYLKKLEGNWIERDREQNREAWTKGWTENLAEVRRKGPGPETCRPRYFRGSSYLRLRNDLIVTPNQQLEHNLLTATRQYLFSRYLPEVETICELGSGSGQNLWLLSEMFPGKRIIGLDWVDPCVGIAQEIARTGRDVSGRLFDMTAPEAGFRLPENSAIVSIHALEQIGNQHEMLLNWIVSQRPAIVVQHEPVAEFYDPANLYDNLALWYSRKRHYLEGYYSALRQLETQCIVRILSAFRPQVGGVFHEASILVWKPF